MGTVFVHAGDVMVTLANQTPPSTTVRDLLPFCAIIVFSGALAGAVRALLQPNASKPPDPPSRGLIAHVAVGTIAAALVPLFLELTSSSILDDAATNPKHYLTFAGMCLVFAYAGERAVERVSSQLLQRVEQAEAKATRAEEAAQVAKNEANIANVKIALDTDAAAGGGAGAAAAGATDDDPTRQLLALAKEYDDVRLREAGSAQRTQLMTALMLRMERLLREHPDLGLDATELLRDASAGKRLLGIAIAQIELAPAVVPALLAAIEVEDKPFNQYWALRVLLLRSPTLRLEDKQRVAATVAKLLTRGNLIGTDRHHLLREIQKQLTRAVP